MQARANRTNHAPPASATIPKTRALGGRPKHRAGRITSSTACKLLDCSRTVIRKLVKSGELAHEVHDGVYYFKRTDVARLATERGAHEKRFTTSRGELARGELAAHAFRWFADGKPAVELVTEFAITPELVEELHSKYEKLRGLQSPTGDAPQKCANEECDSFARFCGACVTKRRAPPAG